MDASLNKLDDYKRVLDYVVEMLPFIRAGGIPQKDQHSYSINDDRRPTQLSEYLIDE
jgi:hypothetical protein